MASLGHFHLCYRVHVAVEQQLASFGVDIGYEYLSLKDGSPPTAAQGNNVIHFNLGKIFDACQTIDAQLRATERPIAIIASPCTDAYEETVLALGAYMIMHCNHGLDVTLGSIRPLLSGNIPNDLNSPNSCSNNKLSNIELRLQDCLGGLLKAMSIGWVDFISGGFDADEYKHLDSPLNADLHEIVPGKLVIMRGPRDLPNGAEWRNLLHVDGRVGPRDFSSTYYADILEQLDVQVVVRCSVPMYDRHGFEKAGIAVVDLCCEEDSPPPVDVIATFLAIAERLPGAIAVHGGMGPGWSGTLVALYMMKHHGFTAREAIGWLQIVRPGRCAEVIDIL
jgi:hypothetical protein